MSPAELPVEGDAADPHRQADPAGHDRVETDVLSVGQLGGGRRLPPLFLGCLHHLRPRWLPGHLHKRRKPRGGLDPAQGLRPGHLPMGLLRRLAEPGASLVFHGWLWQLRQDASCLRGAPQPPLSDGRDRSGRLTGVGARQQTGGAGATRRGCHPSGTGPGSAPCYAGTPLQAGSDGSVPSRRRRQGMSRSSSSNRSYGWSWSPKCPSSRTIWVPPSRSNMARPCRSSQPYGSSRELMK